MTRISYAATIDLLDADYLDTRLHSLYGQLYDNLAGSKRGAAKLSTAVSAIFGEIIVAGTGSGVHVKIIMMCGAEIQRSTGIVLVLKSRGSSSSCSAKGWS